MRPASVVAVAVAAAAVAAAGTGWVVTTSRHAAGAGSSQAQSGGEGAAARVPTGDLAGAAVTRLPATLANPLSGNVGAIAEGHRLYVRMNCADCHGFDGKGAMGPDLTDAYWRYGGTPVQIYKSIYEGRPQGMPAWGHALPGQSLWQLTAYIESLGGSFPASAYHAGIQGDLSAPKDRKSAPTGASSMEGQ